MFIEETVARGVFLILIRSFCTGDCCGLCHCSFPKASHLHGGMNHFLHHLSLSLLTLNRLLMILDGLRFGAFQSPAYTSDFLKVGYHRDAAYKGDVQTPTIDSLVKEGIELNRHIVHSACTPSRQSSLSLFSSLLSLFHFLVLFYISIFRDADGRMPARTSFQSGRLPVHVLQSLTGPCQPGGGMPRNMTGDMTSSWRMMLIRVLLRRSTAFVRCWIQDSLCWEMGRRYDHTHAHAEGAWLPNVTQLFWTWKLDVERGRVAGVLIAIVVLWNALTCFRSYNGATSVPACNPPHCFKDFWATDK